MEIKNLVNRKVFGQWGEGGGWDYGVIKEVEVEYNEVIVKWDEDGENNLGERFYNIKDLIIANENTELDDIAVYVLPIEN